MKVCKKCSECIGNSICEILEYPNNGQCDEFLKLVEGDKEPVGKCVNWSGEYWPISI